MPDSKKWQRWIQYAEGDFAVAMKAGEEYPAQAAFMYHQAGEKFLKAVLVMQNKPVPRTHDLQDLMMAITPNITELPPYSLSVAELLTEIMPIGRYPSDLPEPNAAELAALQKACQLLRSYANEMIAQHGRQP